MERRSEAAPEPVAEPGPESAPADSAAREADEAAAVEVEKDFDALLDETKRERDSYLELAQRTRADFENYRKRMAAEAQAATSRGKAEMAAQLIGVIDNLERAMEAAGLDPGGVLEGEAPATDGALEQGCIVSYREISDILRGAGVEAYSPAGESFDPAWHEALQTRAVEGTGAGIVVEVLQRGYRLEETVLRPARVVVSE